MPYEQIVDFPLMKGPLTTSKRPYIAAWPNKEQSMSRVFNSWCYVPDQKGSEYKFDAMNNLKLINYVGIKEDQW